MTNNPNHSHDNPSFQFPENRQPQVSPAATPAAMALHNNFKSAVEALKRDLVRTIHYLTVISDKNIHRMLGYKSIYDYGEGVAGFTESQTRAFLKIGRRLQELPELKKALASGILSWTKAEKIASRATAENEIEWIALAQTVSARDLGNDLKPGPATAPVSNPLIRNGQVNPIPKPVVKPPKPKPPLPATEKCHVTFIFTPDEYSRWEKLLARGNGRSKEELLLEGMGRFSEKPESQTVTGPEHMIVLQECPTCRQASLNNSRGMFEVAKPLLEVAKCDATLQGEDGGRRSIIPPRLRRQVLARDHHRCQYPGCRHASFLQIHHRVPLSQGGATELENLVTLCSKCHRRLHEDEAELRKRGKDPVL